MRHESKFASWIRSGGNSAFIVPLNYVSAPEVKFSVVPERLLDSIIDDALATGLARLNAYLPVGVSIDVTTVDLTPIRDELRDAVSSGLSEAGMPVNPNDPVRDLFLALTCHGIFPPSAIRVRPMERTDDEEGTTDGRADHWYLAGA